jgi:SulP family sulfate permease
MNSIGGDTGAGFLAGLAAIPTALATAILVFGPLGPGALQAGAAAAMYSVLAGGIVVAVLANSSPMIPVPLIGPNLVLLSLVSHVAGSVSEVPDAQFVVLCALALCVLLAGLWQILLGASGFASAVNFVPYPVLAGFLSGIAILTVISQLKPLFGDAAGLHVVPAQLAQLIFVLALVALTIWFPSLVRRVRLLATAPGPLVSLVTGVVVYALAREIFPVLNLGRPLGRMDIGFPPEFSLAPLSTPGFLGHLSPFFLDIGFHSLACAGVATIETFLAMRLTQNAIDAHFFPRRQIAAFGVANAASAAVGGLVLSGQPSLTMMAISVGGRTWMTPLTMAITVLLLGILFSGGLAIIPVAVLSAILIATSVRLFDPWIIKLVPAVLNSPSTGLRVRAAYDLLVVTSVMAMTVFYSVIGGIVMGCVLACAIFIMRMSQPVVQAALWDVHSNRRRTEADAKALDVARRCVVLKLQGVLFFGNADDLAGQIKTVQQEARTIILDCKRITEIDISGANALRVTLDRSRRLRKQLLFCNLRSSLVETFMDALALPRDQLVRDLDSTLALVEDEWLQSAGSQPHQAIRLDDVDILRGLTKDEIGLLGQMMPTRHFKPNAVICREGDPGDCMWLILRGFVTIGLDLQDRSTRLSSFGPGTTIGEMAMIERANRSANIVAEDLVECYELTRSNFDRIVNENPSLAAKLLTNISIALSQRLRVSTFYLRTVLGESL